MKVIEGGESKIIQFKFAFCDQVLGCELHRPMHRLDAPTLQNSRLCLHYQTLLFKSITSHVTLLHHIELALTYNH